MSQDRRGFTLIELLIVVVIIGVLAAIAIPKFANTKEKAYLSAMTSDLRNLVVAQVGYFADNQTYTTSLGPTEFAESAGVTVTVGVATGTGWSATASHNGTTRTCAVFMGQAAPVAPATNAGQPTCT